MLEWNSTSVQYEFLAAVTVLRALDWEEHNVSVDFPLIALVMALPFIVWCKKRKEKKK